MIGPALNIGSFFLDIATQLYPESSDIGAAAKVTDRARHAYNVVNTSSVHRSAGRGVFAPMVVVDKALLHQEYMQDLMTVINLRDIVATLTHFALQNATGVGVKVENIIGSANPNRGGMLSLLSGLESLDNNIRPVSAYRVTGMESATPAVKPTGPKTDKEKEEEEKLKNQVQVGGKAIPDLMEYTPLSVGRVVNATIFGENGVKIDFPMTFRQIPVPVDDSGLRRLFTAAKNDEDFSMRWLMKRTGEISNPEWFNGTDIVKERFKAKHGDASGYYKEAMKRDTNNALEAVRTGVLSVNSMANSIILGKDEAAQIELLIGKKFSNPSSRQDIFEKMSANTIVICDDDRGIFHFYTDGQSMPESYTRRDLAVKSKKEGSSNTLQDLVKLLNGGM